MATSSPFPQLTNPAQANAPVVVNEIHAALGPFGCYAMAYLTTTGLTWGYYGGRWGGFTVAAGTFTLADNTSTYIVAAVATGVTTAATTATNWNDTLNYKRAYKLTTASGVVTVTEDHRGGPGGVHGSGGGSAGSLTADTDGTLAANSDSNVATQKATKTYVDGKVAGLSWKQAVRAATTANGTLASAFANASVIDGVTLATGDRILLKNQTTGSENGIYIVAASGAPTRATDADAGAELVNATVYVSEGTTLADTQWTCSTNAPITPETTALVFAQLTSAGSTTFTGDVTGSGSGSVALTVANDAVTYAKMQNVSATARIMGRNTAGAGDMEELSAATASALLQGDGLTADLAGFRTIPQNSKSAAYTTVAADSGKHIYHPGADTTARTFTIDSNANVAYPIGTAITFVNDTSAGVVTIAITSDTLVLAGAGTTGSRTLAANGIATAIKMTSTRWMISGTGLT